MCMGDVCTRDCCGGGGVGVCVHTVGIASLSASAQGHAHAHVVRPSCQSTQLPPASILSTSSAMSSAS